VVAPQEDIRRMNVKRRGLTIALLSLSVVVGVAALNFSGKFGVPAVSASEENRNLHIVKTCPQYVAARGAAGSHCTISASNVPEVPVGATVIYDQTAGTPLGDGVPAGFLDSNVLLLVAQGDWAVGRCTLDLSTFSGLCTFSNGVGALGGFRARINVTPAGGLDFNWDGKYNFGRQ
jgi:hypothetical protein